MDANKLLHWLSHLGEGTWDSFRHAVEELSASENGAGAGDDPMPMRFRLSELGDIDFFPEKRRRWQIVPPFLAAFSERPGEAVFCGGRTPASIALLNAAASQLQCTITQEPRRGLPDKLRVIGPPAAISEVACAAGVGYSSDLAAEIACHIVPIDVQLSAAPVEEMMIRWQRKYFDLRTQQWRDEPLRRTACECVSKYGRRITYVQVSRTKTVRLPKREALYAAAAISGITLASYDADKQTLSVPMHAPLPDACARLASISSGSVGALDRGRVSYAPVPPRPAEIIMAALGQRLR